MISTFNKLAWCIAAVFSLAACQNIAPTNATKAVANQSASNHKTASTSTPYTYTLDNGLKVIIKQDKRAPVVMTQIWYAVGSSDEVAGKGGIAHFFEHMMFKDNTLIKANDYSRLINELGGISNAFTSHAYTAYYEQLPANQYPVALDIFAARMNGLLLSEEEAKTENQVVQQERLQVVESIPVEAAFEQFMILSQPNSPMGLPIIGSMQDIKGLNIDDLKAWYKKWYHPANATIVLVGDVDIDEAKKYIDKYFAHLPKNNTPIVRNDLSQPSHLGYKKTTVQTDVSTPELIMGFNVPTLTSKKDANDAYALSLLKDILDGGMSARFERNLVRNTQVLSQVEVYYNSIDKGDSVFTIYATPSDGVTLEQAEAAIMQEILAIKADNITQNELLRGQNQLVANLVFANDSLSKQANLYGKLSSLNLPLDTLQTLPKKLESVDAKDIERLIQQYFSQDNLTVMHIKPQEDQ